MTKYVATTGRVKTYLEQLKSGKEIKLLPASCTLCEPEFTTSTQRWEWIEYIYKALAGAAGVSVHLHNYPNDHTLINPNAGQELGNLYVSLPSRHPDHYDFVDMAGSYYLDENASECAPNWHLVEDSLPGLFGAIHQAMEAGINGDTLVLDYSLVRPNGTKNDRGMVASGPASFADVAITAYEWGQNPTLTNALRLMSEINNHIRRGGAYKNGAITSSLPIWHPLIQEYLDADSQEVHPWLYKAVIIPSDVYQLPGIDPVLNQCFSLVNYGSLWFEKHLIHTSEGTNNLVHVPHDYVLKPGEEWVKHNVCKEVVIRHGETCYLSHANLGQVQHPLEIALALFDSMVSIIDVHKLNSQGSYGIYKPASEDLQVGVGLIGMMNMLRHFKVPYAQFSTVLSKVASNREIQSYIRLYVTGGIPQEYPTLFIRDKVKKLFKPGIVSEICLELAIWLAAGYAKAGKYAHEQGYKRAFCIAPTASCSFEYFDLDGFNCTPNIEPPPNQYVIRNSGVKDNVREAKYGAIETNQTTNFVDYFNLAEAIQNLMGATGKAHAISLNWWVPMEDTWFSMWLESSLTSTYYRVYPAQNDYQDKANPFGCESCGN